MSTQQSPALDAEHPFHLSEADDTALYRLRCLVTLIGDLSGFGVGNPSAHIDAEALHGTCWLMQELIGDIIHRYNLDYQVRRAS